MFENKHEKICQWLWLVGSELKKTNEQTVKRQKKRDFNISRQTCRVGPNEMICLNG